jgi:hypothetical protein
VENEQVARVGDTSLEFLTEADGVGGLGYACRIDLRWEVGLMKNEKRDEGRKMPLIGRGEAS